MEGNRLVALERRAARVAALRAQIEAWRRRRQGRAMPGELWQAAVELARAHGAYRIARALGLSYQRLQGRLAVVSGDEQSADGAAATPHGFVELSARLLPAAEQNVVELSDASGRRLVIRLGGQADVPAMIAAFLR